jgi:SAM-dependent methyltransferase
MPIALQAYELLAEAYAAKSDTKAHNAYCERPATLSLLPDVNGLHVLDAGCGPGSYSEWLLERGARVTAVDASPKMLAAAKARLGDGVAFHLADLAGPLPFLKPSTFDIVLAPLVLDYIEHWPPVLSRFREALQPGGLLIFSGGHPSFDAAYYKTQNYFATEQVSAVWKGFGPVVEVPSFRRSLASILNDVIQSGFDIEQILEPQPTPEFRLTEPEKYESLFRQPCFLCCKARKR